MLASAKVPVLLLVVVASTLRRIAAQCSLCPGGQSVQFLDAVFNETEGDDTCADVAANFATFDALSEECAFGQLAFLLHYPYDCGYCDPSPDSGLCTLCSDGSIPTAPADTVLNLPGYEELGGLTCAQLAFGALFAEAGTENCTNAQIDGLLCGCPSNVENPCTVCHDGNAVPDPEATSLDGSGTCGDLETAAMLIEANTLECFGLQFLGAVDCSCPPVPNACAFCPNGDQVPSPNQVSESGGNKTCGELQDWTQAVPDDSDFCFLFQFLGYFDCGCPYSVPTGADCSLCVDGSPVPDPDQVIGGMDEDSTCGQFEWASALSTTDGECAAFQATAGAACGCANPPDPACDVCDDGDEFQLLKTVTGDDNPYPDGTGLCGEILWQMSVNATDCAKYKTEVAASCCGAGSGGTTTVTTTAPGDPPINGSGSADMTGDHVNGTCIDDCQYDGCHKPELAIPSRCDSGGICYHGDKDEKCAGITDKGSYDGMVGFVGTFQPSFCLLDKDLGPVRVAICPSHPSKLDDAAGGGAGTRSDGVGKREGGVNFLLMVLSLCAFTASLVFSV